MFGFGKSYDNEYLDLYAYLTHDWSMKSEYAKAFLTTYKKSIGKIYTEGKERMQLLKNSSDPGVRLMQMVNRDDEYLFALVGQAYKAYMSDLRKGKHVGTPVELAIWSILSKRPDLLMDIDREFGDWIYENHEERFPNLFDEVFDL